MTKAQQKVQPMQFKAYAEVYTSKRGSGSMEKSAHGGEHHHGQHGNQQMRAEQGQGPGRGGHSDSVSNRHSNTGNNAASGMGMSAPAAQMSNYHDRKRPDMRVFVANPATLVGQQPQMMYPPQVGRHAPQICDPRFPFADAIRADKCAPCSTSMRCDLRVTMHRLMGPEP